MYTREQIRKRNVTLLEGFVHTAYKDRFRGYLGEMALMNSLMMFFSVIKFLVVPFHGQQMLTHWPSQNLVRDLCLQCFYKISFKPLT